MIKNIINISKEFHRAPAGRFISDGRYSGERFRKEFLLPALKNNSTVEVVLDDLKGVGSSFWEEAFGGLIREENIPYDEVSTKITFTCSDDMMLCPLIKSFIDHYSK